MNQIALVVVVFGKKLEDSLTIKSLLNFDQAIDHLVIVNNGPKIINQDDEVLLAIRNKHKEVILDNQIKNKPLSWIYNEFIQQFNVDRYAFFDDDTIISAEYCEKILFDSVYYDLGLPSIESNHNGETYYPVIASYSQKKQEQYYQYIKGTYSIGSGLVISAYLKNDMIKEFSSVFDHHFALYGVDISFFRRLDKMKGADKVIANTRARLLHDLSKFSGEISEFRKRELLIDQVLQFRWYRCNSKHILKMLIGMVLKLRISQLQLVLKTLLKGKHPRC